MMTFWALLLVCTGLVFGQDAPPANPPPGIQVPQTTRAKPARAQPPSPATGLVVTAPANGSGLDLDLHWEAVDDDGRTQAFAILRATSEAGPWTLAAAGLPPTTREYGDKVTNDPLKSPPKDRYLYRIASVTAGTPDLESSEDPDAAEAARTAYVNALLLGTISAPVEGLTHASLVATDLGHLHLLMLIIAVGGLMMWFTDRARKGEEIFIRRIPGIDAIEDGIGRATEMGKPVLYVPGIDELQDIQTIASVLILGQVAKMVAEYQSDIIVSCCIPIVREVADEVVKAGFYQAGHPDAYNPANTRFISSEQFAFCAGTNGIILREKPATCIYLGRFFAESLILAETGFINGSIQIAGTAEATQLPFFIAACDYTLIGEELFAVSAYLSRDPRLVSSLKASDYIKVYCVVCLLLGTLLATMGNDWLIHFFSLVE
jgi:hypothetical protein